MEVPVEFRLLGPVEVWDGDRRVDVGHAKQRCVLTVLLLEAGQVVTTATLIDRVWGHDPPDGVLNVLYAYITRLRKALAPCGVRLVRDSGGYLLDVNPETVDVHRFRRLQAEAGTALDEALALWRGTPFANTASPWLVKIRQTLVDQRLSALIERNEVYLAGGRHTELAGPLHDLVTEHPIDERPVAQLMLALYRSGRRSEALDEYQLARERFKERLGSDPSPYLRRLQQRVLRDDPSLAPAAAPNPGALPVPAGLPHDVPAFVGRRAELAQLDALVPATNTRRTVVISAVHGTAGVGKTALAVHWAHRVKAKFPDGNLYMDLRGYGPGQPADPGRVLDGFLAALDVTPAKIPVDLDAKVTLYRSLLDERQMLIVLDNAATPAQVRPLLPGSARCLVVVTSRAMLTGLAARDQARRISLDVLPIDDAIALLAEFVGPARVAAEPHAARELAMLCARLPVALCVAGERAAAHPTTALEDLVRELADQQRRLDLLDADGDPETAVRAVFSWSYDALTPDAARVFRLLGLHPGPDISTPAAASLAALPLEQIQTSLAELASAHLIDEHTPDRYTFHDLLRAYAAEQTHAIDPDQQRNDATHRMLDHYLHTAYTAARLLYPARDSLPITPPQPGLTPEEIADHDRAMAWFTAEEAVLLAAVDHAATSGLDTHTWQLAWALYDFLDRRGHWDDYAATQRAAVAAAGRLADPTAQARAHRHLARACTRLGRFDDAHNHLRQALDLYHQAGDLVGQAHTHHTLAQMEERQGHHSEALDHARQALDLCRTAGHRPGQAGALNAVGWYHALLGDHQHALTCCEQALTLLQEINDLSGQASTWDSLGYAHHHLGHHDQAIACYRRAVDLYEDLGDRYYEANTLTHLGDAHHATSDFRAARDVWQEALAILDDLDHSDAYQVRTKLRDLGTCVPRNSMDSGDGIEHHRR
jgi:DNA-binding SARP family transcriptional activator/tetratricopeptide (TPR) repeat protein